MSVKTLRHYHRVGLLEPADVDPATGYRRYTTEQIPTAQVIRRFRDLDMPLREIGAVLSAPDIVIRNELIATHLSRLEGDLERTQHAVSSLRNLLEKSQVLASVTHRSVPETLAAGISDVVDLGGISDWYQGALGELRATVVAQDVPVVGPSGGIYANELFAEERGRATIFLPCARTIRPVGRVTPLNIPGVELATTVHTGPHRDLDRAYGALAAYVTQHELVVDGPVREYYLVDRNDTADESLWRTEIGWPIFQTR
jgi:DNA-binding transcriptional MerR regulator/effector-binding domain-containing protein